MRFFKDKKGRWAIWQEPNFTLVLFWVFLAAWAVIKRGLWHDLFAALAFGTIFMWSWMEIRSGVSPFRRVLGAGVMAAALLTQVIK